MEADQYVMQVLGKLEQSLTRNLNVVRNGINELNHQQQQMDTQSLQDQQDALQQQIAQLPQDVEVPAEAEQPQQHMHNISLKRADDVQE